MPRFVSDLALTVVQPAGLSLFADCTAVSDRPLGAMVQMEASTC
jgi:hypothetical protein